ncbi:MAG: hypothetical protein L3J39_09105 [Verrucomicrobiales bacterium]|nr:hypothetical protein [Verrucomicrobiales bacterium]
MNSVLKALERNEEVIISHRGTVKGTIIPVDSGTEMKVEDHPFFGSDVTSNDSGLSVEQVMEQIRKPRSHDL